MSLERFEEVEEVLFRMLVTEPFPITGVACGSLQPRIQVGRGPNSPVATIMVNREVSSGYWDHPFKELPDDARLLFIGYFDWDWLMYRGYQYVLGRSE